MEKKMSIEKQIEELYKIKPDRLPDQKIKELFLGEVLEFVDYLIAYDYAEDDFEVESLDFSEPEEIGLRLRFALNIISNFNIIATLSFMEPFDSFDLSLVPIGGGNFERQFSYLKVSWDLGESIPDIVGVILNRLKYKIYDEKIQENHG